ncbi:MAG: hypothetical protein AB1689_01445 [Thermodesulfobacteriota bacterium]
MPAGPGRAHGARRAALALLALTLLASAQLARPPAVRAGIDLVRLDGVLGVTNPPGTMVQTTLSIGAKSVPFAALKAERISGDPFEGPGVLLALGPGPPPIRVEGRSETIDQLVSAPAGTRVVLIGNLNVGPALLTLMSVEVMPSASPSARAQ